SVLSPSWAPLAGSAYGWVLLHQGGRYDAQTGLYHFRNRDFSPALGRWVSPDPIGFAAGDPNLYRYVGNDPLTHMDPTGLFSWSGCAGGAVGGGIAGGAVGAGIGAPLFGIGALPGGLIGGGLGAVGGCIAGGIWGENPNPPPGQAGFNWGEF